LPKKDRKKESLFKRRDWFLSGGLIIFIYLVLLISIYGYMEDRAYIVYVIHVLPLLVACLFMLGYFDKRKKEESLREKKQKRYQARLELSRIQRESGKGEGLFQKEERDKQP